VAGPRQACASKQVGVPSRSDLLGRGRGRRKEVAKQFQSFENLVVGHDRHAAGVRAIQLERLLSCRVAGRWCPSGNHEAGDRVGLQVPLTRAFLQAGEVLRQVVRLIEYLGDCAVELLRWTEYTLPVLTSFQQLRGRLLDLHQSNVVRERVLEQVVSDLVAASRESPTAYVRSRTHAYHRGPEDLLQRKGVVIEEGLPVGLGLALFQ